MALHLDCPGCDAKFSVEERFAGRAARCKKCGRSLVIPSQASIAAAHGTPRHAPRKVVTEPAAAVVTPMGNRRPDSWIDAVNSHVGLVPISQEHLAPVHHGYNPALLDEPASGPYVVASAPDLPALQSTGRPAGKLKIAYREQATKLIHIFRWINQTAYLISVPFIMIFLFGVITKSHTLTALGATAVILLNLGRLVSGLANLIVIPFRDSPIQGLLFLIPPFTFIYLARNWTKVEKSALRVVGPLTTVGIIILTFAFTPWLRGHEKSDESIKEELQDGVTAVKEVIREELDIDHPKSNRPAVAPKSKGATTVPSDLQYPG